jgi:hypothetical protein
LLGRNRTLLFRKKTIFSFFRLKAIIYASTLFFLCYSLTSLGAPFALLVVIVDLVAACLLC